MKLPYLILLFLFIAIKGSAQAQLTKTDEQLLQQKEDSLQVVAREIVFGLDAAERFRADSLFTRILVRALKTPYSFQYPFDSVVNISRVYAPDSTFRLFSWQVMRDEDFVRRHGAIQVKTEDGSLKLFPLIDRTASYEDPLNQPGTPENWVGAIYYRILLNQYEDRKYYTLLGYDENSIASTMKRIEVMNFRNDGTPVIGETTYFSFAEDSIPKPDQVRFWIEYRKEGNARLQYDEEMNMIIFDHLIPENGEVEKKYTYIPDGDYEGFRWKNGKWVHIDKIFTFALKDGEAPAPIPVKEDKLTIPSGTGNPAPRKKKN